MKYAWKRYWLIIFLVLTTMVGLILLAVNNIIKYEIFFGGVAFLLTLFISIINFYQNNDKFFKELFTEFNKRYDDFNDFLNAVKDDDTFNEAEKEKVMDYFNLCAEEYMWVKKGRIPPDIWKAWKNGIQRHLSKAPIRKLFEEERAMWKGSYYGFFDEMK